MTKNANSTLKVKTPEAEPSLLERAINRHMAALRYFENTTYLSDSIVLGREPTETEQRTYTLASTVEEDALLDICALPVVSFSDLIAKTAYVLSRHSWRTGHLTEDQINAFRASLVQKGGAA